MTVKWRSKEVKDMTTINKVNVGLTPEQAISAMEGMIAQLKATKPVVTINRATGSPVQKSRTFNTKAVTIGVGESDKVITPPHEGDREVGELSISGKSTGFLNMKYMQYKTGSDGYFTFGKITIDGVRYQFTGNAVRIGSKQE